MNKFDIINLQRKRMAAYKDGEYEMDDWEGFTCTECGNRQLSAAVDLYPDDDDENLFECTCGKCGGKMETSDKETDWDTVREKIPEEYITGEAMETDLPECPKCKRDIKENQDTLRTSVGDRTVELHEGCAEDIWDKEIENPFWYDSFTPEHYEKAADYLRSLDCVGDVITRNGNDYVFGEMVVHTNFATTSVVKDVIGMFGGQIEFARVAREDNKEELDCVSKHGTCFEIHINFHTENSGKTPPEYLDRYSRDEAPRSQDHYLLDYDREPFFDADFTKVPDRGPESVPDKHRD